MRIFVPLLYVLTALIGGAALVAGGFAALALATFLIAEWIIFLTTLEVRLLSSEILYRLLLGTVGGFGVAGLCGFAMEWLEKRK